MTKKELKEQLQNGKLMSDLFDYTYGQDCDIYKNDEWELSDDIIYIPDIQLNNIDYFDYLRSKGKNVEERIEEVIDCTYTGKDFMELADGDEGIAKELFYYVDWQHPSSALDEVIAYVEEAREEEIKVRYDYEPESSFS